jgi:HSP20 family protein
MERKMANETGKSVQAPGASQPARWEPLRNLHDELDRMMSGFFGPAVGFGRLPSRLFDFEPLARPASMPGALVPRIDVSETDDAIQLAAELPGMEEKDVDLAVQDDVLTIRGEKKLEKEEKRKDYHLVERQYGSFQRSFSLPDSVDRDKIGARFEKGVLHVTLPKTAQAKKTVRKIAIGKG